MEEKYNLSVCGKQTVEGNTEKIELETSASYVIRGDSRYISYKEYDPSAPEKHYRTTVKVTPDNTVTVMKGGAENHHLILEEGQRHKCEYNTPFGSMTLGIYTESSQITLDDKGGEVFVRYTIDIESELASTNELTLKIKEAEHHVNSSTNSDKS